MDLINKIPLALNNILKEDDTYTKLFHDSLPRLLLSYGSLCAERGVYAEIPFEYKQTRAFWSAISHHHSRRPEETAVDCCFFWLGFDPNDIERKRLIIDEAAQLLTQQNLTNDIERDKWLNQFGDLVFPGYKQYSIVMKMNWSPA